MAIHRTYIVRMAADGVTNLDIVVEGPVGTAAAPVNGGTAPPAGWVGGTGQYYEWRGRTLRIPVRNAAGAAGGFVPRFRLGWKVAIHSIVPPMGNADIPNLQFSQSLIGTLGGALFVALAEPAYGPTIRVLNGGPTIGDVTYAIYLSVYEAKDEDKDAASAA